MPPVILEHMDIFLSFTDGRVEGRNTLRLRARQSMSRVVLNARDLDVHSVRGHVDGSSETDLAYALDRDHNLLTVTLPRQLEEGEGCVVHTVTTCTPSDSVLEGIYKDTTPPGCPQQYMSQCQQWGFQRILPVIDDCTAKCTMTTTIEADSSYTHLISNGNISRTENPDGVPVLKPDDPSRKLITYENPIPMAPYLFIVCVGTWDMLEDEVIYPSGRRVRLEYLVPPGRLEGARVPMQILKDSVLWQNATQGYEYRHDVYRTICMEKSNFGGMENVGNTTIVTDAALVDASTTDRRLAYAHGVIVHEFEHNQCGSDVTMETPFDMWLNEAYTVDVERQFLMSRFDPTCERLDEVDSMRSPVSGPLAVEDAGHLGNIVREGFNDPDELVDGVTYVKAAEVIRMLRSILGEERFTAARDLYFQRFDGGNANTDHFFECFEQAGGRDLGQFRREWLETIGYPHVTASYAYDAAQRTLSVTLAQERRGSGGLFHVPVAMAAVDGAGRDIAATAGVYELTEASTTLTFPDVPEPAFMSINRDCSFYGSFEDLSATPEQLAAQVENDPNLFNRVEAMRRLTERQRVALVRDPGHVVSEEWLAVFGDILHDETLPPGLKAYLLRIDEDTLDRAYIPLYRERYAARQVLLRAVSERWAADLKQAFMAVDTYAPAVHPLDGYEERRLKAVLLQALTAGDTPETHRLAEEHFRRAWNMSDRIAALRCIHRSSHPQRREILEEAHQEWQDQLSAYTAYLSIIGSGTHDDLFTLIGREAARPHFRIDHPTHARALFMPVTGNNKMLWTPAGLSWLTDTVLRMSHINEMMSVRLVACLQQVARLAEDLKSLAVPALESMRQGVDATTKPSLAGRLDAYLAGVNKGEG